MSQPFIGEIRLFGFSFAPRHWALCQGQLLPINQNQTLFALLGTTYGGDGRTTFALPDFRSRAPVHAGTGPALSTIALGETGGAATHSLSLAETPAHSHTAWATTTAANQTAPNNALWASTPAPQYSAAAPTTPLAAAATTPSGGSQPHNNQQPYLVLNFCIALQGVFPSHS